MPRVTVLIPTYNCGKYLLECLGSVFRQSFTDYEILIIDDGSTDNTQIIIEKLHHHQIRYVKNEKNLGIVGALNRGLDIAEGEYIARLDADDIMLGERLKEQIYFLDKKKECGLLGGNYQVIDKGGQFAKMVDTNSDPEYVKQALLFRNQFHHSSITMRTELAKQLRYDEAFRYCEDYDMWLRFAEVSEVTNLPRYHLSYRWHPENSCSRNQSELKERVLELLSRELDKIEVPHTGEELMLHAAMALGMGITFFKDKQKMNDLNNWHDKVFESPVLRARYSNIWLTDFRKKLLKQCVGIDYIPTAKSPASLLNGKKGLSHTVKESDGVSVIMPTYNQAAFISAAISSLFRQSFKRWELIIINDGSTDDTENILQKYLPDPRIRYIKNLTNLGLGKSINIGLDAAQYDLIAYLPSDDLYHASHLEKMITRLMEEEAFAAIAGIIYLRGEKRDIIEGLKSYGRIKDKPLQLVQMLHAKTAERWVERNELTTADLDVMFWDRVLAEQKVAKTYEITCEWVNHFHQRHKKINETDGGGLYVYKQYYNVEGPFSFDGNVSQETITVTPTFGEKPLTILLAGDLSNNPERINVLREKGHQLYGLWIDGSTHASGAIPFSFANIKMLTDKDAVSTVNPDVIYALLNYSSVPLAYDLMLQYPHVPFVWHFKEDPAYCRQRGTWDKLMALYLLSDAQIYSSPSMKDWFDQYMDTNRGLSFVLDGDLPGQASFGKPASTGNKEKEEGYHTVLMNFPDGILAEDFISFARQNIHIHFYGQSYHRYCRDWIARVNTIAPNHLHLHDYCKPEDWVNELAGYDAGWLNTWRSNNQKEVARTSWRDVCYPKQMPIFAAAGLPMLHWNDTGHISASWSLLDQLDIGLVFDSYEELGEKLGNTERMKELRDNVNKHRLHFSFDQHANDLICFFRKAIASKEQKRITILHPAQTV